MTLRLRTIPVLACIAILAASLPCNAEAGFGLFKRFKKRTACPKPAVQCCPTSIECVTSLPTVKKVTGMICYTHPDYPGYPLEAYDPDPQSSTTKNCTTLETESCNSIILPSGGVEFARGCYEASGCDDTYSCVPCSMMTVKSPGPVFEAQCFGWCRHCRCIKGTIIRAPRRDIAVAQACAALNACSQHECCGCLVRTSCCVKRVR